MMFNSAPSQCHSTMDVNAAYKVPKSKTSNKHRKLYQHFCYYFGYVFKSSSHPGVFFTFLLGCFAGFSYIYEDTNGAINKINVDVFIRAIYAWALLRIWIFFAQQRSPSMKSVWEEPPFRAPLLTTHSSGAAAAMNTNSAMGQQEEALKQGPYLWKAGEKFGICPAFWKLKWARFCFSWIWFSIKDLQQESISSEALEAKTGGQAGDKPCYHLCLQMKMENFLLSIFQANLARFNK